MSLPHAILTALLEKPSSGLELTRRFDMSIGYFWSATHQQIYRELGKLEQAGFIRALPQDVPTRGQKREYEVLPAGREELVAWVAKAEDPKPLRDAFALRLRAAAMVGTGELLGEVERHLGLHRVQLATYREIEKRDFPAGASGREERIQHLVLRAGIEMERFWVGWLEEATVELRELDG
ncbi:PadR family transcriptional regulator [Streptomyces spiroverticillatus]|uniref:PadR family transcriptional regulator n=1 Tax=Streptomyces finlayi TaxID=67296 RepID=A0A918X445_9ACTN|nr:PadR family transcriptional regulator [Streptomyces finlayi]GHA32997.1 PadR family transcriptional regulator [Streptomyces spiroverticillatus]GHD10199.1 PadR family transcriptional regulator [Streptomyces finlayi]